MKLFNKPEGKMNEIAERYKKGKEIGRISIEIEYKGKKYREIIYNNTSILGKPKGKINGVIFIDERDEVVTDKRLHRELSEVFFHLEQLFDESFIKNLTKSIVSENTLKSEEAETEAVKSNLLFLSTRDVYGADKVMEIVSKLPQLKRENNEAIKLFIDKVKGLDDIKSISTDIIREEIKSSYTAALMKNFEKISLIGSGRYYYSDIKKEAARLAKRKMTGMGNKLEGSPAKLDYELGHLIQVVKVYEQIIDMSSDEYSDYLKSMDKSDINEKIEKNRA